MVCQLLSREELGTPVRSPELYVFPHCACTICDDLRHTAAKHPDMGPSTI